MKRSEVIGPLGTLAAFWVMCLLLHWVPLPEHNTFDRWWSFPWVFTCIGVFVAISAGSFVFGEWLMNRRHHNG